MLRNSQSIPAIARRTHQYPPPQHSSSLVERCLMCMLLLASWFAASVTVMALPIHSQQLTTLGQQPDDPLASAHKLVDEQKYPEAETQVRAYLEGHLLSAEAHFLLGFILFRENKAKESLAEYTAGARYKSPSAADLKIVAFDYVLIDDYADAEKWLIESTQRDPANADSWYSLGRVQYKLNHFQQAITAFERSLALEPRSVKSEDNLGLTLAALERNDEAIAAYRTAIAWQAGAEHPSEQPLLNLGILLLEHNQLAESATLLEQAVAIAPTDPKIHEQLGRVYLAQGKLAEAAQHLERAVALAPDDSRLHYQLGQVYRRQGLADKAKAEFARTEALSGSKSTRP
jgi:tetratricopeptide (TPR) repeat protein